MRGGETDLLTWVDRPRDPFRGISVQRPGSGPCVLIPHEFNSVRYYGVDYRIQHMQVFGCGDEADRDAQLKQKQWERAQVQKSQGQKLHLEQNWQENPDKQILEMAGIRTEHADR